VVAFASLGALIGATATLLRQTRARFTGAFDDAPNGILLTDSTGHISAANEAASRMLGRNPRELIGETVATFTNPLDLEADDAEWQALLSGDVERFAVELRLVHADGQDVPVMVAVSRMSPRSQKSVAIVHLVDMSAQRQTEQRLAHLADHDPLTTLFNRRRFDQELGRHLLRVARQGPMGAVLLLDLDHFKYVNDTLGHTAGDVVLRAVANALRARARAEDVLCRLGGDEFAILMPDVRSRHDALMAAADILLIIGNLTVALPRELSRSVAEVRVTASIGVALIAAFADAEALLTEADLAMYEAKAAGRGQARVHSPDSPHAQQIRAGFTWGERIRRALDEHRFDLWMQPIVSLNGTHHWHYEALLRLRDGERISHPVEFLRHAERLGLMAEIDDYVVQHAVALLAGMTPKNRPRLEVNLSAAALGNDQLADRIATTLKEHRVPAHSLIFEITETLAIANLPLAATTISQLRRLGCGFALDDFGVGVSSFYYLRELPFDILKIDGAFVQDLATNLDNQVIVRAMIDAAHGLGKTTIAEFVDSDEVADILRDLSCDYAQGHLFGKAQPPTLILGSA